METSDQLDWIRGRFDYMYDLLLDWSHINSGSHNIDGLSRMSAALQKEFQGLGGTLERLELPPLKTVTAKGEIEQVPMGGALRVRKRPDAPLRVFLGGHMDTVFAADHAFQSSKKLDANTLNGPGVADLKGGLIVMLVALQALERSPQASKIGWEVLINPDEEIGSQSSAHLLEEAAKRNHLGLIVEPALRDGTLAGERKGSGNFTAVVRGRAAHAGREPHLGRNAIRALADFVAGLDELNGQREGLTVNVGRVEGGGPTNIVPDLAVCEWNVRYVQTADESWMHENFDNLAANINQRDGLGLEIHGAFTRPPKPLVGQTERLFGLFADCGRELNIDLKWKATGGCCDGNNLAAFGLPNVDTLGVRGGAIHSAQEFMMLDSLVERSQLMGLFLLKLAAGEIAWG